MRKVMICVDLSEESLSILKQELPKRKWESGTELHFVHCFRTQVFADSFFIASYPTKEDEPGVIKSVEEVLSGFEKEVIKNDNYKFINKCIISTSPKDELRSYAIDNAIDEMVIGTREHSELEAIFSSSIAEYMVRHAPCELRIIRG